MNSTPNGLQSMWRWPPNPNSTQTNRERIGKTLQLAEELGARTRTLAGRSIPEAVLDLRPHNNITKIVVGKPLRPRWREWLNGSVVDQLIYASGDIDVYVISAQPDSQTSRDCRQDGSRTVRWGRYLARRWVW